MLFEVRCPGCDRLGWCPCDECVQAAMRVPASLAPNAADGATASTMSLFAHAGVAREFVHALKFRRQTSIGKWLAQALATNLADGLARDISLVTWAPTSKARRRARGYDQAELLARGVARSLARPAVRLLVRTSSGTQSALDGVSRLSGPSFELVRRPLANSKVLMVDDVLTTGATLRCAATALGTGIEVHAATVTRASARSYSQNLS